MNRFKTRTRSRARVETSARAPCRMCVFLAHHIVVPYRLHTGRAVAMRLRVMSGYVRVMSGRAAHASQGRVGDPDPNPNPNPDPNPDPVGIPWLHRGR